MNESDQAHLFPHGDTLIPRFREAGDVTLDLLHHDARVEDNWLRLGLNEFELLWRLAEHPGTRMTCGQLQREGRRAGFESGIISLAVHVARIRRKLAPFGLARLVATHARGGYFLDAHTGPWAFGVTPAPSA